MMKAISKIKSGFRVFAMAIAFLSLHPAVSGQADERIVQLTTRFQDYCRTLPMEDLYVHTDRPEYMAGENMWFSITLFDRQSMKLSSASSIAYVELLNADNRPVVQKRILLREGRGPGEIVIPDTLSTGTYILRAYTSWMKNLMPFNCFMKKIAVYNVLTPQKPGSQIYDFTFDEKPSSDWRKQRRMAYGAEIENINRTEQGAELSVRSSQRFRTANREMLYLAVTTHGVINLLSAEAVKSDQSVIAIPRSVLIPGINQVTIFDSRGDPVDEKYIYTPEPHLNDRLFVDTVTHKMREQVNIDAGSIESLKGITEVSVSVSAVSSSEAFPGIDQYMVFGSEFGPAFLNRLQGRRLGDIPAAEMDSILSGISSNWIRWPEILSSRFASPRWIKEKDFQYIYGHLQPGESYPDDDSRLVFICTPGKKSTFAYARAGSDGKFRFPVHIDGSLKDLVVMPAVPGKNQRVAIEPSFSDRYVPLIHDLRNGSRPVPSYISDRSVAWQVQKIYNISSAGKPSVADIPPVRLVRFYGVPDYERRLDDYIKLPLMEEVIFELLPQVSIRKRNDVPEIIISEHIDNNFYVTSPVLMIDGVIIKDPALIINLDPETVERIDVVKGKYLVGRFIFPGILNVITREGDFSNVPLPDYMIRYPYRVAEPVSSFISPRYINTSLTESRVPDFRNTLYWNPAFSLKGNAGLSFWCSDMSSDYEIRFEGVSGDGKLVSARRIISVK